MRRARASSGSGPPIERVGPGDRAMLAMSAGAVVQQQLGAVLLLDTGPQFDLPRAERLLAERVATIPRLRQRLVRPPLGGGGPLWVDDPGFEARRHVRRMHCPGAGDERALLDLVAEVMSQALPRDRPLWSATFVTGLADSRPALVVVLHHVLVDGIGGLAVLGRLVDPGPPAPAPSDFPRPRPSYARLLADAVTAKGRALRGLPAAVRSLRRATTAGGGLHPPTAAPCSLLRPTSGRSRFAVVRTDLTALLATGHRAGGTLNDALLAAVAGALAALLERRGESVETLVLAVLVNARRSGTAEELGNAAIPLLVAVPTGGTGRERLRRIAGTVRAVRPTADGPSMIAGFGPLFRLVARAGLYRRYIEHQHRLHTLVSDVPGPRDRLAFDGAPIRAIVPVSVGDAGNVTVNFLALSYADVLTVTVVADPEAVPDLRTLAALLHAELDALVGEPVAR